MTLTNELIMEKLREVIDPELGINIVDLGLIYNVDIRGSMIYVDMTLTTQGCPMRSYMEQGVHGAIDNLEGVDEVDVNIVFDPPWGPEKISPEGMEELRNR